MSNKSRSEGVAETEPLPVAVYIRVSTAREEMISPDLQLAAIEDFVKRQSETAGRRWKIVSMERDLDQTGRDFARDGVNRLIAGVAAGTWCRIVVYNYSRFGRNLGKALFHIGDVESNGGQVVSATEPFDTFTAIGKFSRAQMLALAQLQSDQISEGWKATHDHRLGNGLPGGGTGRWGYDYHCPKPARPCPIGCPPGTCVTGFTVHPVRGPVLARLYERFIAGEGLTALADWLAESEYPTSRGQMWSTMTVARMLDSGFGAGLLNVHDRTCACAKTSSCRSRVFLAGAQEAVISPETWVKFQVERDRRKLTPYRSRNPRWALSGIAVCGLCGRNLVSTRNKGKEGSRAERLVRCSGQTRGGARCSGVYIVLAEVEEAALTVVSRWASHIEAAATEINSGRAALPMEAATSQRARLHRSIEAERAKIGRWSEALGDGSLPLGEYRSLRTRAGTRISAAERQLLECGKEQADRPSPKAAGAMLATWPRLDPAVQRGVFAALIEKVVVYPIRLPKKQWVPGEDHRIYGQRIQIIARPHVMS
jgi:site-specific DNA recombinase